MAAMDRREFLKLAGMAAGAAAVYTFWPGGALSAEGAGAPKPVLAASAVDKPTFAAPAIVKSGNPVPFTKAGSGGTAIESLWLQPAGKTDVIALAETVAGGAAALAPAGTAPAAGMYDLFAKVTARDGARIERQPLAVKFVDEFKKDFVFGVIGDVHFGDPRVKAKLPDFDTAKFLKKEIDILNGRGAEFCLACGDFCFTPPETKNEILDYVETVAAEAKFPTFSVPGNHDGYTTGAPRKISFDTMKYWTRYFGTPYYDASYGDIEIIGINTYDKDALERNLYGGMGDKVDCGAMSPAQLAWLESVLKKARAKPDRAIIILGHQNPTNTVVDVNGPFVVKPFSDEGRRELLDLIVKYEPDAMFVGHVHGVHEEILGKTKIITTPATGSIPFENQALGFLIVTVKNGKIASYETIVTARV